jgi:hypothetical protein
MSTQNLPYIVIVDSPSATAADTAEVSGGEALIKDGAGNQLFKFKTNKGIDGSREFGLAESPKDADFAVSAATVGLETALIIVQDVDEPGGDGLAQVRVAYTAVTGDTTTTIAEKLVDLINKHKSIKVTASNVANTITLVGDANYPLWSVVNTSNLGAETSGMETEAVTLVAGLSDDTQDLTVASSAGFSAGDTITLSGFTTGDGDYVVYSVPDATSILVINEGAAITGTGDAVVVAQERKHAADDLISAGIKASFQKDSNGDPIEFTAGATYLESKFSFMAPKGYGGFNNQTSDQEHLLKVYVIQDATAANLDAAIDGLDAVIAAI